MPIYAMPTLYTVVLRLATSIQASCTRHSVGAMSTFKTKEFLYY